MLIGCVVHQLAPMWNKLKILHEQLLPLHGSEHELHISGWKSLYCHRLWNRHVLQNATVQFGSKNHRRDLRSFCLTSIQEIINPLCVLIVQISLVSTWATWLQYLCYFNKKCVFIGKYVALLQLQLQAWLKEYLYIERWQNEWLHNHFFKNTPNGIIESYRSIRLLL